LPAQGVKLAWKISTTQRSTWSVLPTLTSLQEDAAMSQADIQIPLADVREIYRVTDIERAQEDAPAGRDELQLKDLDASRIQRGKTRMGF
jgi:hypothetical protein